MSMQNVILNIYNMFGYLKFRISSLKFIRRKFQLNKILFLNNIKENNKIKLLRCNHSQFINNIRRACYVLS